MSFEASGDGPSIKEKSHGEEERQSDVVSQTRIQEEPPKVRRLNQEPATADSFQIHTMDLTSCLCYPSHTRFIWVAEALHCL